MSIKIHNNRKPTIMANYEIKIQGNSGETFFKTLMLTFALFFGTISSAQESDSFQWPDGNTMAVSLTWDDGRSSQVTIGTPILDAHDVKATFYVGSICGRGRIARVELRCGQWSRNRKSFPCSPLFRKLPLGQRQGA